MDALKNIVIITVILTGIVILSDKSISLIEEKEREKRALRNNRLSDKERALIVSTARAKIKTQ